MDRSTSSGSEEGGEGNDDPHYGPTEWVLLRGNRLAVSGLLLTLVLALLVTLEIAGITAIREPTPLFYVFSAFIGGNLTLITVVLSINQLVLSRQLEAPGKLQEQLRTTAEFRRRAAETTNGSAMPVLPPDFLHQLLRATREDAETLEETGTVSGDDSLDAELQGLTTTIVNDITEISALLEESGTGPFHALSTTLNTDFGHRIHRARRMEVRRREDLPEQAQKALDELVTNLELLDVTRKYFKTLFMQKELSYLSRLLLYVGIPAEVTATVVLLTLATGTGSIPAPIVAPVVVPLAVTVSFAPLAVLFSFVLRIATVTERTVAIAPFTTPERVP